MSERAPGDLWPFVRAEVGGAYREMLEGLADPPPGLWDALEARFRRGQAEHGHRNEWLRWTAERFEQEQAEELLDLILYRAMRRFVCPDQQPAEW